MRGLVRPGKEVQSPDMVTTRGRYRPTIALRQAETLVGFQNPKLASLPPPLHSNPQTLLQVLRSPLLDP